MTSTDEGDGGVAEKGRSAMKETRRIQAPRDEHLVGQRGSALIMAIVVLFLLAVTGISLLFLGESDKRMNIANVRDKRTFFIAEAGLEDAREQLRLNNLASADTTRYTEEITTAAGADGFVNFDPTTLSATYDASGNVTGLTGYGDDVPLRGLTTFNGGWYAAFLTNDAVDGVTTKPDPNHRAMITAIGAGPKRSIKMVQAIVEKLTLPTPPAMITLIGPAASTGTIYDDGTSNSKLMRGNDCVGATGYTGVPGASVPVVGTTNGAATAQATAGADSGDYSSAPSPIVADVSGSAGAWQNCSYLHDLADMIRGNADAVCTTLSPCSTLYWNATTNSSVTFVDGNWTLPNGTNAKGLIWVTGTASIGGNMSFEGTLVVVGTGVLNRSGGGSGHSYGALVVADIAGPDNTYGNADDCTGGVAGFDVPTYVISGGGTHDHIYCSQAITVSMNKLAARVAQFRQY
jgi:hypothetical protein